MIFPLKNSANMEEFCVYLMKIMLYTRILRRFPAIAALLERSGRFPLQQPGGKFWDPASQFPLSRPPLRPHVIDTPAVLFYNTYG